LKAHADASGKPSAPVCANLIVHRSNARLEQDLQVLLRHRPEMVITSVGSPAPVIGPLHDAGALVFADVASIRHAERAVAAGADGLVLLTAGAGGQTGWLNPFVFVRAVRAFFDGRWCWRAASRRPRPSRGRGARLRSRLYGHKIHRHAREHGGYQIQGVAGCQHGRRHPADDGVYGPADQHAAALDRGGRPRPDNLPQRGAIDIGKDIDIGARENRPKRWKDIWSAGHSVSGVTAVLSVDEMVARTSAEYRAADLRLR
jgi:nitronate monooxygenase